MNQYIMCVAVQDGKLEKIFERLDNKILLAAGWNKDSKEAYVQGGGHRTETIWFNFEYEPEKTMFEMG